VSRALAPKTVALTDQILATLADEGGLPIATPDLWRKISPYRPRSERLAAAAAGEYVPPPVPYSNMFRLLNRLAELGDVEKITVPEMRACYWRRWPSPEADAELRDLEAGQ
jgi:hypothetical protein